MALFFNFFFNLFVNFECSVHSLLQHYLWTFPFVLAILLPFNCIICYVWAIYNNQIEVILVYVSDIGTLPPQAAFFSQLFDTIAVIFSFTAYYRSKQLAFYLSKETHTEKECCRNATCHQHQVVYLNTISPVLIYTASISCLTLSNFRFSEWPTVHLLGAFTVFPCIYTYAGLSVYLIHQVNGVNSETAPTSMHISTLIGTVAVAGALVFTCLLTAIVGVENILNVNFRLSLRKENDGYWAHFMAALSEWVAVAAYTVNFLCLARRMKRCKQWNEIISNK